MRVRVLGPFEVDGGAGPVVLAGAAQRTVLAALALRAGQPVGVNELVDTLWPDDPPPSARNSLQSHVTRLRAALGVFGLITLEPAGYRLNLDRSRVDALLFEDLAATRAGEAVALWRGTPLPEFPGEPFRGAAARLGMLHRAALVRHAAFLPPAEAAAALRAFADADPCWEEGTLALARALAAAGWRGDALEALRRHGDAVADRLGLGPSDLVRRTQLALLRGDTPVPLRQPAAASSSSDSSFATPPAESGAARRGGVGSVPLRFSSFVGRDSEQRELAALLAGPGLVSVVGPGGVGKTRLVAETVRAAAGVAWVDAAAVREEDLFEAVAVGVGARLTPNDDPLTVIAAAAATHRVVVLDNCEHVLGAAARVAGALSGTHRPRIGSAPTATSLVVTSQESLRVDGERVLRLGPLDAGAGRRLFRERARVEDSPLVGDIVERLDLLPLAIELAATQAAVLGVGELHARLDDRLDLLDRGSRGGDARHRTLRAVVAWSFGLLDGPSALLLHRLAVFAGAFTVAVAEAVAADEQLPRARIAALLAGLVDRSLVSRHGPGRFRLLETVRAYASENIGDDHGRTADPGNAGDDRARTEVRHASVMAAAAGDLDRRMRGPEQAAAVREIDALLPDLRLAAAMYRYGYRCQQYEVLAWGRAAMDGPPLPDAFAAAATHAWGRGDLAEARDLAGRADPPGAAAHEVLGDVALVACEAETALAHYRAMDGEPVHRVSGLVGEALVLAWSGRVAEATARAGEAVALADATGNPSARAEARYGLGEALGDTDPQRALALFDEAVALAVPVDDRLFRAAAGTAAVAVRSRHGDPVPALAEFREVLRLWRLAGNDTLHAAALRNLIVLLVRIGADETAVLLDGALPPAEVYPAEAARLRRARAAAAERLGPDRVAALRRRGELLGPSGVTAEVARAIDAALARGSG
ncbi:winged helix-turn-helix domain-containing protein [Actinoplanes sp. NPDC023801]|uniref:winged helix-turn-helix domain-containing protein n=1 Tax=Actinoplanes sp. NPDC023801 TaxID=3154595 RepID=UPI00340465F7